MKREQKRTERLAQKPLRLNITILELTNTSLSSLSLLFSLLYYRWRVIFSPKTKQAGSMPRPSFRKKEEAKLLALSNKAGRGSLKLS